MKDIAIDIMTAQQPEESEKAFRARVRALGYVKYNSTTECEECGSTVRYTHNGACCECAEVRNKAKFKQWRKGVATRILAAGGTSYTAAKACVCGSRELYLYSGRCIKCLHAHVALGRSRLKSNLAQLRRSED